MARYPDEFTRKLVAANASHGLVLGLAMGAAVSLDPLHSAVLSARVARGEAVPVFGDDALVAVLPDVRDMTWEQVAAARELPGLPRLRAVLADVEAAAREAAPAEGFDSSTLRLFQQEYSKATDEAATGWASVWSSASVGIAISLATSQLGAAESILAGGVVGVAVEAGQLLLGQERRRNTWISAADQLRAMAGRSARPSGR